MKLQPTSGPFTLTICGVDELGEHRDAGVSHVLSLLDPEFPSPPAFGSYGEHERLDLRFHDIIDERPGLVAPQRADVESLLAFGADILHDEADGLHLLVHCHMGISRSTAAMAVLLAQAAPSRPAPDIFAEILRLRPRAWPNLRIVELGDALLGRGGTLVAGVREHYRACVAANPHRGRLMAEAGRVREVEGLVDL